jgi:hypothetical protein
MQSGMSGVSSSPEEVNTSNNIRSEVNRGAILVGSSNGSSDKNAWPGAVDRSIKQVSGGQSGTRITERRSPSQCNLVSRAKETIIIILAL